MDKIHFYAVMCAAVVIIGVLLILYIREICQRKNIENRAAEEIKNYLKSTDEMSSIYERLFPSRFLELFGVRKVTDISTRLSRTFMASVISVNTMDFTQAIHTMTSAELFETLNKIFAAIIPGIVNSGGIIEKFEKAGIAAFYLESGEDALMAAISLCEAVDKTIPEENSGHFSVGLDYGEIMLGIAGHQERISTVAMSESISISEFLQTKAEKYGARILVTANFTGRIQHFRKNYNSRFLGYFYDGAREVMVRIYDVYDGDHPDRKQRKRRTRMIFEQGVESFIHRKYGEARLYFVEVLKADRYDLAAREYLYLCDTYSHQQETAMDTCIEKF